MKCLYFILVFLVYRHFFIVGLNNIIKLFNYKSPTAIEANHDSLMISR